MSGSRGSVVVGIDNGATTNNATALDLDGRFLVTRMLERPSRVREGPEAGLSALEHTLDDVLGLLGAFSPKGSTNFEHPGWRDFDLRGRLEDRLTIPVTYCNDANAAALYDAPGPLRQGEPGPLIGVGHRGDRPRRGHRRVRVPPFGRTG